MLTETRAGRECGAVKKFGRCKTLFAFELHLKQFEQGVSGASYEKAMVFNGDLARGGKDWQCRVWLSCAGLLGDIQAMDDQFFPVEGGKGAGPGLKGSPAIVEFVS